MRVVRLLLFLLLGALAIFSVLFVRGHVTDAGTLIANEQHARPLSVAAVERVVRLVPDGQTRRPGLSASCTPLSNSALHNPWSCMIDYGGGLRSRYTVQIRPNGRFTGTDQIRYEGGQQTPGHAIVNGCCIAIP